MSLHERLAHLHLSRIVPNPGNNPQIKKENDKQLRLANFHLRQFEIKDK